MVEQRRDGSDLQRPRRHRTAVSLGELLALRSQVGPNSRKSGCPLASL